MNVKLNIPNWNFFSDDMRKANFVKEKIVNDDWWDKIDYIIDFTRPIYDMIRVCETDRSCLHLVYEMWDSMIEKVLAPLTFVPVATCPFAGELGEAHGCAFQRRKDARSRHQRLFLENIGKTEGNRSKRKF